MPLRFDRFLVDEASRRVLCDGADVHLTPKAFELLMLLIDRRPAAVSKSAIMEALWPATFVLEANVANLVAEIRGALGDNSGQPRFVRTVPRFGYAFSGELRTPLPEPTSFALLCAGGRIPLAAGSTVLGREGVAAELLNSPMISRRHVRIDISGEEAFIEDLGSKNGCMVEGERITSRVPLQDGQRIRIGEVVLTFVRISDAGTQTFHGPFSSSP